MREFLGNPRLVPRPHFVYIQIILYNLNHPARFNNVSYALQNHQIHSSLSMFKNNVLNVLIPQTQTKL